MVTAFPTHAPLRDGHLLVVPNAHLEDIFKLDAETYHHLFDVARKLAAAVESAYQSPRVALIVSGLEVPHLHLHVCPIFHHGDTDSGKAKLATPADIERVAETVRAALK
jgi:diadenosine tetraphosphate (Ap4A) HIT family hydrolase